MNDEKFQPCFENSRRLLGPNRYFDAFGAVLEASLPAGHDPAALARWQENIHLLSAALGWPKPEMVSQKYGSGAILAISAPLDQLQLACDVNEISWDSAVSGFPLDLPAILPSLRAESAAERDPNLMAMIEAADARGLPVFVDDEAVSIGIGAGGQLWPRDALPPIAEIAWHSLAGAPLILVTGTNGKTTSVRLCAAMAAAQGAVAGYNCTDGVVIGGERLIAGDYAGPEGARRVVRHPAVTFAVLETARGGILRRGLAARQARAAIVTNISPDHFGEYGVDSLEDLAETKLTVARAVDADGLLVVNGENPLLLQRARRFERPIGLFALEHNHPALVSHRAEGGASCGVQEGRMILTWQGREHDLGLVAEMPLTIGGTASYNIMNIAASALAAAACAIPPAVIRTVLAEFGRSRMDNPGRMERWSYRGTEVLLDYAHNPDGMQGLLTVAQSLRQSGRLGLLLGQAGNRKNEDIRQLAAVAASSRPDLVLLKDEAGYLRGRKPGEVPSLLHDALIESGMEAKRLFIIENELDAAFTLLVWARPGDVAILSVHSNEILPRLRASLDLVTATC